MSSSLPGPQDIPELALPESISTPQPETPAGQLFAAARQAFIELGFEGATTRQIAERAGMNPALIHYYFGTKEKLYRRVLATELLQLLRFQVAERVGVLPIEEVLVTFPTRMLDWLRHHPDTARLIRRELGSGGERARSLVQELGGHGPLGLSQHLKGLVSTGIEQGRVRPLNFEALLASLLGLAWGMVLIEPILELILELDLRDEDCWQRQRETLETLLSRGLKQGDTR
ncbi:MAG: TetR/AcrR family transcriptional regulator [Calditrichaeota bacterium]|nr:TetR/AcrR family transcriptional regulator [Calditrichota bacterium]